MKNASQGAFFIRIRFHAPTRRYEVEFLIKTGILRPDGIFLYLHTRMLNVSNRKGFTLVELLVVITILAIISVVAYTSFGGATDKAKNSTKLQQLASID